MTELMVLKLAHLMGVVVLLAGLGSLLTKPGKVGAALHGAGLLLLLISGLRMAQVAGYGFPWWVIAKVVIWLALGAMLALIKREVMPPAVAWTVTLLLALTAVVLGWKFGVVAT